MTIEEAQLRFGDKVIAEFRNRIIAENRVKAIDPDHYTSCSIEPINVIENWNLGFALGNAVKYIARAGKKGAAREDLIKAANYCFREATGNWLPKSVIEQEGSAMALKPRPKGIPIGNYTEIIDAAGKQKIKPKRKAPGQTLNQQYASKNRKKWRAAK